VPHYAWVGAGNPHKTKAGTIALVVADPLGASCWAVVMAMQRGPRDTPGGEHLIARCLRRFVNKATLVTLAVVDLRWTLQRSLEIRADATRREHSASGSRDYDGADPSGSSRPP
jgi:hypothetical protein